MISYETIISEIQKHAGVATGSDAKIREELAAIRALCDVALSDHHAAPTQAVVAQQPVQQMQYVPVEPAVIQQAAPSLPTKKIHEEDANGDSLFDF